MLPLHIYKKESKDLKLEKVKPVQTSLVAYRGSKIKVIGHARLRVFRNDASCFLDCRLVESQEIRPILGKKACLGMNIIQYNDNDLLNKPKTSGAEVYTADPQTRPVLTREEILAKFPTVFSAGIGQLDGEYSITSD